ncbi:MAG TPA: YggS family pyridoxal phosphate-dependent enzyme, partial [Pyrinomonadaceae bacterium]
MTIQEKSVKSVSARFEDVSARIRAAAVRVNRDPGEITLVGIGKTHPASTLREALDAGMRDLGENRVQEAESKIIELGRRTARWHLVGHLQANKARKAVRLFDVVHSLDSRELAERLDRMCIQESVKELSTLIQVDLGGESTKTGIEEHNLAGLAQTFRDLQRLR